MLGAEPVRLRIVATFPCFIIPILLMFSEQVELRGHIIDSLILPKVLDDIVRRLRQHGAEVIEQKEVQLVEAPADGVFPPDFYVTTNQQTFIHLAGKWIETRPATMDCGIAVDPDKKTAATVKFSQVRKGMLITVGHHGIRVVPLQRSVERRSVFEFMASNVSSEKPKSAVIREVAAEIRLAKGSGSKILVVAGP